MSQTALTYQDLVESVKQVILRTLQDPDIAIRITKRAGERPEFVVISDAFEDLTQRERQDKLWEPIKAQLGADAQRIALILPRTWNDVR